MYDFVCSAVQGLGCCLLHFEMLDRMEASLVATHFYYKATLL